MSSLCICVAEGSIDWAYLRVGQHERRRPRGQDGYHQKGSAWIRSKSILYTPPNTRKWSAQISRLYSLPSDRKFDFTTGPKANGSVNQYLAVQERIREFAARFSANELNHDGRLGTLEFHLRNRERGSGRRNCCNHSPTTEWNIKTPGQGSGRAFPLTVTGDKVRQIGFSSPSWTRTSNLAVNSRSLYQLSYRGSHIICSLEPHSRPTP